MTVAYSNQISEEARAYPSTRWLVTIFLISILFICYVTLFPFDFFLKTPPTFAEIAQNFDKNLLNALNLTDIPRNIILFIPIGFAFSGLCLKHGLNRIVIVFSTLFLGMALSATVEILQMYSINRSPTIDDILANTIGTLLGFVLYLWVGQKLFRYWKILESWLDKKLSFLILSILYIIFILALLLFSYSLKAQTRFSNWETDYALILGNEYTADRAWNGFVTDMYFFGEALEKDNISSLLQGQRPRTVQDANLLAAYNFTGNEASNFPIAEWQGTPALGRESEGALLSQGQWLVSEEAGRLISRGLMDSNEFTVGFVGAPTNLELEGPARIVSISQDIYLRNFTIGQTFNDLNLRIRTPFSNENGRHPEFVIPNVFTDTELQHIILTYDGATIQLYIDNPENVSTLELLPAVVLFSLVPPASLEQMRINGGNMVVFHLLYNALYLVPLAGLLVYKLRKGNHSSLWNGLAILIITIFASTIFEIGLSFLISGYRLQMMYILMNIPLFLVAVSYFWWVTRPHLTEGTG